MDKGIEALIAKVKKQTESFDTAVLKEDEAKALIAALEQAQSERDKFNFAHKEWNDKTEWVQKESTSGRFRFQVLGMHRADVMTRHIDELEARTLSFALPDPSSKAFWGGTGKNETFYPSTYKLWLKEAIERAGIIAGVKIEVI